MTWEWEHRSNGGQWVVTVGTWHAVVQRVAGARPLWQATLARTTASHEHSTSSAYPEAVDAPGAYGRSPNWLARRDAIFRASPKDHHHVGR